MSKMKTILTGEQVKYSNLIICIGLNVLYVFMMLVNGTGLVLGFTPDAKASIACLIFGTIAIPASIITYFKYKMELKGMYIMSIISLVYNIGGLFAIVPTITYVICFIPMVLVIVSMDRRLVLGVNVTLTIALVFRLLFGVIQRNMEVQLVIIAILATVTLCIAMCLAQKVFVNAFTYYTEQLGKNLEDQKKIVEAVSTTVNQVFSDYQEVMGDFEVISKKASQNRSSMHSIAKGMEEAAEDIQNQVVSTTDIQSIIQGAEKCAENVEEQVKIAFNTVELGVSVSKKLSEQSNIVNNNTKSMSEIISKLSKRVEDVSGIVQTILSISEQTNLLALNASIEAARAGEAGRGFAVVASEIRNLAENTKISTEKITDIIFELKQAAEDTDEMLGESVNNINEQSKIVNKVNQEFIHTGSCMEKLKLLTEEINQDIARIFKSNEAIVGSITQLSAVSEEIVGSSQTGVEISDVIIEKNNLFNQRMEKILNQLKHLNEKVQ